MLQTPVVPTDAGFFFSFGTSEQHLPFCSVCFLQIFQVDLHLENPLIFTAVFIVQVEYLTVLMAFLPHTHPTYI